MVLARTAGLRFTLIPGDRVCGAVAQKTGHSPT